MKKLLILILPLLLLLGYSQGSSAARYYRTYEVVEIRSDGIVLRDTAGKTYLIDNSAEGLKTGDLVRYDSVRKRLKKYSWQIGRITGMTDSTVTLQLNNGESVELAMRLGYRDEFSPGDTVYYQHTSGQIRKGDVPQAYEEQQQ